MNTGFPLHFTVTVLPSGIDPRSTSSDANARTSFDAYFGIVQVQVYMVTLKKNLQESFHSSAYFAAQLWLLQFTCIRISRHTLQTCIKNYKQTQLTLIESTNFKTAKRIADA